VPTHSRRLRQLDHIEVFYNPLRRHSALDDRSPVEFEEGATTHELLEAMIA